MRKLIVAALLLAPVLPTTAHAADSTRTPGSVASIGYALSGAPATGFSQITQVLTVRENPMPRAAWIWADEVQFVGDGAVSYFGLQPTGGGSAVLHVGGTGTNGTTGSCTGTADKSAGTNCRVPYPVRVGRPYTFSLSLQAIGAVTETWRASVTEPGATAPTVIGVVSVPLSRKLIRPAIGFAQYLSPVASCTAIPQMTALFGAPVGVADGKTYKGKVTSANAVTATGYRDCRRVVRISRHTTSAQVAAPRTYTAPTPAPTPSALPSPATPTATPTAAAPFPSASPNGTTTPSPLPTDTFSPAPTELETPFTSSPEPTAGPVGGDDGPVWLLVPAVTAALGGAVLLLLHRRRRSPAAPAEGSAAP